MRARIVGFAAVLLMVPLLTALNGVAPASAAVRTKITLSVAQAPIAQTAAGDSNRTVFQGRVTPARKGARVTLQRRVHGKWYRAGVAVQNRYGNYSGMYVARQRETLRAVSKPGRVRSTKASRVMNRVGYRLTFGENFSGSWLNSSRWETRWQPKFEKRKCAQPASDRVRVGKGVATLSVRKVAASCVSDYGNYGEWSNAMIGTRTNYRYGYFAARVKFQSASGMHGAFWLQGPSGTGAEIDVAEFFGASSHGQLTSMIHYTPGGDAPMQSVKRSGKQLPTQRIMGPRKNPWNSYHVYAVKWTPSGYQFFLDGKPWWSTRKPHVSTAPSQIILSLVTSDWELKSLTNPSSVMTVDWVRGWQAP